MKWLNENFRLLIIVGILIIFLPIGYYFFYSLPSYNKEKLNFDKEKYEQEQNAILAKKVAEDSQNESNKNLLDICLKSAEENYASVWAANCISNAKKMSDGYESCAKDWDASGCRISWGTPDPSSNCALPLNISQSIKDSLEKDNNDCFKQYPQK